MTTRRRRAVGLLLLLASLALGVVLGGPAGAVDPGPAYPPAPGGDEVVRTGDGGGSEGSEGSEGDDVDPSDGVDGSEDGDQVDPADADRPDGSDDGDGSGDEVAADGRDASDQAAPGDGGRGARPFLIVGATAIVLFGGIVAIARRL